MGEMSISDPLKLRLAGRIKLVEAIWQSIELVLRPEAEAGAIEANRGYNRSCPAFPSRGRMHARNH